MRLYIFFLGLFFGLRSFVRNRVFWFFDWFFVLVFVSLGVVFIVFIFLEYSIDNVVLRFNG